jgi:hypothetical protein
VFCYAFLIQLTLWRVALCFSSCRRYDLSFSLALSLGTFFCQHHHLFVFSACIYQLSRVPHANGPATRQQQKSARYHNSR